MDIRARATVDRYLGKVTEIYGVANGRNGHVVNDVGVVTPTEQRSCLTGGSAGAPAPNGKVTKIQGVPSSCHSHIHDDVAGNKSTRA